MDQRVSRKPTISDVARQAGISTATVSRTLAAPEKVTAQTRAIVMEAVRKIGYVPNLAARNLRTNRTRTILAVLPDFSNVFFSRVLRGISDTLVAQGYSLIIADTRNNRGTRGAVCGVRPGRPRRRRAAAERPLDPPRPQGLRRSRRSACASAFRTRRFPMSRPKTASRRGR